MSNEDAENLMETIERKWDKEQKHNFLNRMEHKLSRKEHSGRR